MAINLLINVCNALDNIPTPLLFARVDSTVALHWINVAPYSYLKFRLFYATFVLAKFKTNTLKARQCDYLEQTPNALNYLCVKKMI